MKTYTAVALAVACAMLSPADGAAQLTQGTVAVRAALGLSVSDAPPVLPGLDDEIPAYFGMTGSSTPSSLFALDVLWMVWSRSFPTGDAPSLGLLLSVDDRVDLTTNAVSAGLRVQFPPASSIRPYATAGPTWVRHEAKLDGSLFLIPGTLANESSQDWTWYWGGGIDARFGAWGASLDYRRLKSSASFGDPFDVPEVELGGSVLYAGVSWWPGR